MLALLRIEQIRLEEAVALGDGDAVHEANLKLMSRRGRRRKLWVRRRKEQAGGR